MTLEQAFRQALAELELLSHGGTVNWSPTGRSKAGSRPPTGTSQPPHITYRERWRGATDAERPEVLDDARRELRAWKRREAPVTASGSEDEWILEDGKGFAPEEVARRFNRTPTQIRRLRLNGDRDVETGERVRGGRVIPRLQDLVEQGFGARQIVMLIPGVARSTAQDAINRHRKAA